MFHYHLLASARVYAEKYIDIRPGQALFNVLPGDVANCVCSTLFDPFHRVKTWDEVKVWMENHLIFDGDGCVIAVFNNNQILWEHP